MSLALLAGLAHPGPVFAPLRFLSAAYTDVFRASRRSSSSSARYGMPALELQGVLESDLFWAIMALTLVYSAYVAEVYGAGIQSVHASQTAAARSSA